MKSLNRATLEDVARMAGVSKMAASVVLNGARSGTRVSDATRARINAAAVELDYRVNPIARSLRTKQTDIIGFYSGNHSLEDRSPYLSEILLGIRSATDESDKDLLMFGVFDGKSEAEVFRALSDGRVDGLVIHAAPDDPVVKLLAGSKFPVVAHTDALGTIPSVVIDDEEGGRMQARLLHEFGHRRVLVRTSKHPFISVKRRTMAFLTEAENLGIETKVGRKTTHGQDHALDADELALFSKSRSDRYSAIACWDDGCAYVQIPQLIESGLKVPDDVAIVGYNGVDPYYPLAWDVTSIDCQWDQVARTAVKVLLDRIQGKEVPLETRLPVRLRRGGTV
ncbi:MAG: LacI family DNA-binding transcriptional regulator [Armatimonadetes bacterium]|nr:LacI family DNA-binding transcriptional regulator [Armatimonadota bacterium]